MDNVCVVIRPIASWAIERADPARIKPFAHRWADTRTVDLNVLARRRECFIALAAGVRQASAGNAALDVWIQAVVDNRGVWDREWDGDWRVNHYHSRFARNGFIAMRPVLESLDHANALALVFRFLDDTCPRAVLGAVPSFAA